MCGIAGVFRTGDVAGEDIVSRLEAMARAQLHRGPDDAGRVPLGGTDWYGGLANRRLAIRDLSPAGRMPMGSGSNAVWLTYNGEIYNTDELRPELERRGYTFRSESDAEVLLHGYEEWGEGVVGRLRGIFAFGVVDTRAGRQKLCLARDPLGVKPLYYTRTATGVAFASELRALTESGLMTRQIDPAGLVAYLMLGSVPNPLTIYRDAQGLPPGSTLTIDLDRPDRGEARAYWRPPAGAPADDGEARPEQEAIDRVRQALKDAVRSQLVSDAPLGAFLSGGLDSSAVVALMRASTAGPIRTCSMVFEEAGYSEELYGRAMADAAGAEHFSRVITARELDDNLDRILWAMDQPTVDAVNTYFVSQTAREAGLTVALSGLGGDELFGGYPSTFKGVPRLARAAAALESVPGGAAAARVAISLSPFSRRWAKAGDALRRPVSAESAYIARRGLFAPSEVRDLVGAEVWEEAAARFEPTAYIATHAGGHNGSGQPIASGRHMPGSWFGWISRAELGTYTHDQLLRDTDVMSMAHSLEVRVPLLDQRLINTVLQLPDGLQSDHPPKWLLSAALGRRLPRDVRSPRSKQGFTLPFEVWISGRLRRRVSSMLDDCVETAGLRRPAVRAVWTAYRTRRVRWSRPWALAVLANENVFG
jgi:asparagine synthase (glutamine-hydrolysing)